jgi:hypothetical protein
MNWHTMKQCPDDLETAVCEVCEVCGLKVRYFSGHRSRTMDWAATQRAATAKLVKHGIPLRSNEVAAWDCDAMMEAMTVAAASVLTAFLSAQQERRAALVREVMLD